MATSSCKFLWKNFVEKKGNFSDKAWRGVVFYSAITIVVYAFTYYYELTHPLRIPNDPNRWHYSFFHFAWQYVYILPIEMILLKFGYRIIPLTIIICSMLYPILSLLFMIGLTHLHYT
ncbi:MAG: hypothetical protein U0T73_02775 [Chitinophagales bacterium]